MHLGGGRICDFVNSLKILESFLVAIKVVDKALLKCRLS